MLVPAHRVLQQPAGRRGFPLRDTALYSGRHGKSHLPLHPVLHVAVQRQDELLAEVPQRHAAGAGERGEMVFLHAGFLQEGAEVFRRRYIVFSRSREEYRFIADE